MSLMTVDEMVDALLDRQALGHGSQQVVCVVVVDPARTLHPNTQVHPVRVVSRSASDTVVVCERTQQTLFVGPTRLPTL